MHKSNSKLANTKKLFKMKLNYIPHANWMCPTVSITYEKTYLSIQDKRMHMYICYLNTFRATIFPAYLIIVSNAFENIAKLALLR